MLYRFGDYELDEDRMELRRDRRPVELQPKAMQLLVHLVRHRDRVMSKEELLGAIWPDTAVTESSLTRAVSLVRDALGDHAPATAIVNVPRVGYRFDSQVEAIPTRDARVSGAARYIGRAHTRARLAASLGAALSGAGRVLLLTGESGIGKTRTAELLAEQARDFGARVVAAGAELGDSPHRPWARALRTLAAAEPEAFDSLAADQRADLAGVLADTRIGSQRYDRGAGTTLRTRFFESVQAFVARVAAARPVALILEDLHSADSESLWLLDFIGPSLAGMPIAIVATCREHEGGASAQHAQALDRLLRSSALERWPLDALTRDEIGDFVRLADVERPDPHLVTTLEEQTGGNPLLLAESLRSLDHRGLLDEPRGRREWETLLPVGIRHLVAPKLKRLPRPALDFLACAATRGLESEWALLVRCCDDDRTADANRRACEAADLLRPNTNGSRLRFPHMLIREAVYAELVPEGDARRIMHARIAAALDEDANGDASGEALAARAHHTCKAVPRVEPYLAAKLAVAAAEQASRQLGFERAATWYQRALDALQFDADDDIEMRARILLGLGASQIQAFGLDSSRVSYSQAADHARAIDRPDLFVQAALGFAHRPSSSGSGDGEVIALLEEALQHANRVDTALSVRVGSRLAAELRYAAPERSGAMIDEAIRHARRIDDPALLAQTLDDCSFVRPSSLDPESWLTLNAEIVRSARAARDLELELMGHKGRVTGFLELGDVNAVDREMRSLERTAGELRTPYAHWLGAAMHATRALMEGDFANAERHIHAASEPAERADSPDVAVELLAQAAYLRLEQGRALEILEAARSQVRRFPDMPAWRATLARLLIASDRHDEAHHELERLAAAGFDKVPRDRGLLPAYALAAEVTRDANHTEIAANLYAALLPYARLSVVAGSGLLYYGPVAHHLGQLAAVRRDWPLAFSHFDAALSAEECAGARVWQARTRAARARALLERGRADERAAATRSVEEIAERAASHGWMALVAELRPYVAASA